MQKSKIAYFAVSYWTVLGATFASLYPDHVGKMVLDGVVDAVDYYNLGWRANLYDADEAVDSFSNTASRVGLRIVPSGAHLFETSPAACMGSWPT